MFLLGVDRLEAADGLLKNKRVGLITNPTGLDSHFRSTVDLIRERYFLTALYAPEHGIRGDVPAGGKVETFLDPRTGVPVHSLFGQGNELTDDDADCLVYDIQDVGTRFYTYVYTMTDAMQAAAKAGKTFVVLDRPDPLGLETVCGSVLDERFASGVGRFAVPSRYALTAGEFARYINEEYKFGCDLHVIPCAGLTRADDQISLGLPFVMPSPNIPTFSSAVCYVGTVLFEGTNVSEGRGTARPFECFGAPWIDPEKTLRFLNGCHFEGAMFREFYFRPFFSKYAGEFCRGIDIVLTDHRRFDAFGFILAVIQHLREEYPEFAFREGKDGFFIDNLFGTDELRRDDFSPEEFILRESGKIEQFCKKSESCHLY